MHSTSSWLGDLIIVFLGRLNQNKPPTKIVFNFLRAMVVVQIPLFLLHFLSSPLLVVVELAKIHLETIFWSIHMYLYVYTPL